MKALKVGTQIAIIGATQSGKTSLAVGLAKTSNEDFTVGFDNKVSEWYLQPRMAGLAAGHWPEPTNEEDKDIRLRLNTLGGKTALISFKEYKGERIHEENYLEQIVGKPNGALILLNPGMDLLHDPEHCEKLIGNLKGIIDHLQHNKCVAVAFVVTACDRLKTDLKDFAEKFENVAAEVTNYLNTSGMNWKRFDVTITGELADQKKPSIAVGLGNTSREPFLWIMDSEAGRKRLEETKRIALGLVGAVAVGSLALGLNQGWRYWTESSKLEAVEREVSRIESRISCATLEKSESDLKEATDDLGQVIASNQTFSCRFERHNERLDGDRRSWAKLYDVARAEYLSVSMDKRLGSSATRGSEDECMKFDELLENFKPSDANVKMTLTNRWNELRPRIREGYDVVQGNDFKEKLQKLQEKQVKDKDLLDEVRKFKGRVSQWNTEFALSMQIRTNVLDEADALIKEIGNELDLQKGNERQQKIDKMTAEAAKSATPAALETLRRDIASWSPYTEGGKSRKEGLNQSYETNLPVWEQAYSDRVCREEATNVVTKVRSLDPVESEAGAVCDALEYAYGFAHRFAQATPDDVFCDATNKIQTACTVFLDKRLISIVGKWKDTDRKAPEICKEDKDFIEVALDLDNPSKPSEKVYVEFLDKLDQEREKAYGKWLAKQKEMADIFIKEIKMKSAVDMFEKYRTWYEKYSENPFATNVDAVVEMSVSKFYLGYIQEWRKTYLDDESAFNSGAGRENARERYLTFQKLCLAIAKDSCGLKDSWCAKFSVGCRDKGKIGFAMNKAFESGLLVSKIDVEVAEDGPYNDYIGGKFDVIFLDEKFDGTELSSVQESFCRIDGFNRYVAGARNSWHTIWTGSKRLSLTPWKRSRFYLGASLDLSLTPEDAKGDGFRRVAALRDVYKNGYLEGNFKCHYRSLRSKHQYYTCKVRIYCTFEGLDILELYNEARK